MSHRVVRHLFRSCENVARATGVQLDRCANIGLEWTVVTAIRIHALAEAAHDREEFGIRSLIALNGP